MAIRILRWMAFLLTLLVAAGVGGAYWLRDRSDALLRDRVETALADYLPHWDVSFTEFDVDTGGVIGLTGVTLKPSGDTQGFLEIPRMTVRIDRDLLLRHECVVVQTIELDQPTVWINRSSAGQWNWEQLAPFPRTDRPCPEIIIRGGTVILALERTEEIPASEFEFRRVNARLEPAAYKQFHVEARTDVDYAGALALEGSLDLNRSTWELRGTANSVNTQDGLLEMAAGFSPELRRQMEGLANRDDTPGAPIHPVGAGHTGPNVIAGSVHENRPATASEAGVASQFRLPELGLTAEMALQFSVSRSSEESPVSYSVDADIRDGQIINDALPMPLFGLRGHVTVNDAEVVIEELSAENEQSRLSISGRIGRDPADPTKDLTVKVVNLELARSAQKYLHVPQLQHAFNTLNPAGRFNLDAHIRQDSGGAWEVRLNEFTALGCSMMHEKFQYPVTDITGSIRQEDERFLVELDGRLGDRPVAIRGFLKQPGPEMEAKLTAHVENFPINEQFVNALQQENQQPTRRAIQNLRLRGLADVDAEFVQRPGSDDRFWMKLDADVHDASLNFERFPYRLTDLQGRVYYDSLTEKVWYFRDLQARHGETTLSGAATFDVRTRPGTLDLRVTALQAPLDAELQAACITANPALDTVWREIRPSGLIDAHDITVVWQPGTSPLISIPSVALSSGRFSLASHPYDWNNVAGSFAWRGNRVTIEELRASHGATSLYVNGRDGPDMAYLDVAPKQNLAWNLHLQDARLRDISDGPELRRSTPDSITKVLEALQLRGPVNIDVNADLKASSLVPGMVTARWESVVELSGNDLFLGVDVSDARGQVHIVDGVWDGSDLMLSGYVNLTSLNALDMPFRDVHGPFSVDGDVLTLGVPAWKEWLSRPVLHSPLNPYAGQQLQVDNLYADAQHEGRLGLDAVVLLGDGDPEQVQYRVDVALRSASLRKWADDQGIRERLDGTVNGALALSGVGTSERSIRGRGWVQISPAELYELPLLVRIFSEISFEPPRARGNEKPAFKYALGDFEIHDGVFDFTKIQLIGDVINLVGWGQVSFVPATSGELAMHFLTEVRNRIPGLPALPIISQAAEMFGKHWLHVSVTGTVQHPRARTEPRPPAVLTDPIRTVMEALGAGQLLQPPRRDSPLSEGLAPRRLPESSRNPM